MDRVSYLDHPPRSGGGDPTRAQYYMHNPNWNDKGHEEVYIGSPPAILPVEVPRERNSTKMWLAVGGGICCCITLVLVVLFLVLIISGRPFGTYGYSRNPYWYGK